MSIGHVSQSNSGVYQAPGLSSGAQNSFDAAAAAGISPVSPAAGTQLEEVASLAEGWGKAIAAADAGMRSLQVR